MSSLKSAVRSYVAAMHRIEKAQQRRNKQIEKERLKKQYAEDASNALQNYEQHINELISIHKEDIDPIGWQDIRNEPPPLTPVFLAVGEQAAEKKVNQFVPSFFDKVFGYQRKLKRLKRNILLAGESDKKRYADAVTEYEQQCKEWKTLQIISEGVLKREPEAYKEAVAYFRLFTDTIALGSNLSMSFKADNATVDLQINDFDIIPTYVLSQTSTGKLSKKTMPITKGNKLYQEHVCSAVLRVARDMLCLLPVKGLVVNAISERLNTATGKVENQVLLSVLFYPEILNNLNFYALDPTDAMRNFMHRMKFTNSGGFTAVEKIDVETIREYEGGKADH